MSDDSELWPESREFYDAMQRYRHAPRWHFAETVAAYEAVKALLRAQFQVGHFIQLCTGCPCHELPLREVSTVDNRCAWCGCPLSGAPEPS